MNLVPTRIKTLKKDNKIEDYLYSERTTYQSVLCRWIITNDDRTNIATINPTFNKLWFLAPLIKGP